MGFVERKPIDCCCWDSFNLQETKMIRKARNNITIEFGLDNGKMFVYSAPFYSNSIVLNSAKSMFG